MCKNMELTAICILVASQPWRFWQHRITPGPPPTCMLHSHKQFNNDDSKNVTTPIMKSVSLSALLAHRPIFVAIDWVAWVPTAELGCPVNMGNLQCSNSLLGKVIGCCPLAGAAQMLLNVEPPSATLA